MLFDSSQMVEGAQLQLGNDPTLPLSAVALRYLEAAIAPLMNPAFASIANKPSTLLGYGITDAMPKAGGNFTGPVSLYADPTYAMQAATKQYVDQQVALVGGAYSLPTASTTVLGGVKVDGTTITVTDGVISAQAQVTSLPWSSITGRPTTLAGYGITNAQPYNVHLTEISNINYAYPGILRIVNGAVTIDQFTRVNYDPVLRVSPGVLIAGTSPQVTYALTGAPPDATFVVYDLDYSPDVAVYSGTCDATGAFSVTASYSNISAGNHTFQIRFPDYNLDTEATVYIVNVATADQVGSVRPGTGLGVTGGVMSLTAAQSGTFENSATAITPLTFDSTGRLTSTGAAITITPAWTSITGKPTTLTGYGITDAMPKSGGTFTGPVTLSGDPVSALQPATKQYVDALAVSGGSYVLPTASTTVLGGVKVDGTTITISNGVISSAGGGGSSDWASITGKPTTIAGYGITDAVKNKGGWPSLARGADASKPGSGNTTGDFYWASDTGIIYVWDGAWLSASQPAGSSLVAGSYGTSSTVPVVTVNAAGTVTGISTIAIAYPVTSVAGRTGAVTLSKNDVALNNVLNVAQVENKGGWPSLAQGTDAAKPASGNTTGAFYWATDTGIVYRWSGTAWTGASQPTGSTLVAGSYGTSTSVPVVTVNAAGTVTNVTALAISYPVNTVAGRTGSVVLSSADVGLTNVLNVAQVENKGGWPSLAQGADASKPGTGNTTGAFYWATDTGIVYRWSGSAWTGASQPTGSTLAAGSYGSVNTIPVVTVNAAGTVTNVSTVTVAPAWTSISGKPTTLSGYGITDAATSTHTHTFASLTSKPTTIDGYGITDGVKNRGGWPGLARGNDASKPSSGNTIGDFYWASDTGISYFWSGTVWKTASQPTGSTLAAGAYGSATAIPVVTVNASGTVTGMSTVSITPSWTSITGKPTTLAGYGITDATSLTSVTPSAVAATAVVGTATTAARADHVHAITSAVINTALGVTVGSNAAGTKTISTSAPSGGANGDVWYQV